MVLKERVCLRERRGDSVCIVLLCDKGYDRGRYVIFVFFFVTFLVF